MANTLTANTMNSVSNSSTVAPSTTSNNGNITANNKSLQSNSANKPNYKLSDSKSDVNETILSTNKLIKEKVKELQQAIDNNLPDEKVILIQAEIQLAQDKLFSNIAQFYTSENNNQKQKQELQSITELVNKADILCKPFQDNIKKSRQDKSIDEVSKELDGDITSHNIHIKQQIEHIESNIDKYPTEIKTLLEQVSSLLNNPPTFESTENLNSKDKLRINLEYGLKLNSIYHKLDTLKSTELSVDEKNNICLKAIKTLKLNSKVESYNAKFTEISTPVYKHSVAKAIIQHIDITSHYNKNHNMYFWKQHDETSCAFASICNSKGFNNIDELEQYLVNNFSARTLSIWLMQLLENKNGIKLGYGLDNNFSHDYNFETGIEKYFNDTKNNNLLIGLYNDDKENKDTGHILNIQEKDNKWYLLDSAAKDIQKFDNYQNMIAEMKEHYQSSYMLIYK